MLVSKSEKLGGSVLGCRLVERAEHVPIKKRRFVYRSPSPPLSGASSTHSEKIETERLSNIKCGESAITTSVNGTECDVEETNLARVNREVVENEDFAGISMLPAAVCSKGFGGEGGHAEGSSVVEKSLLREGSFEISTNDESCYLSKGVPRDDLGFAEMSTEGTSCISAVSQEENATCMRTGDFSANNSSHRNNVEDNSMQDHSVAVLKDVLSNREEERKQDFSSREVRLHWDLNTAMDSWKHPFDYEVAVSKTNATNDAADVGGQVNCRNLEGYELQTCPDDSKTIAGKELPHSDYRDMPHEMKQSNIEEHESEQENLSSSVLASAVKVDQVKGKKPLNGQERSSIGDGFVDYVPADSSKRYSASINDNKSAPDQTVSGTNEGLSSLGVGIMVSHVDKNPPFKPNDCMSGCVANAGIITSSGSQAEKQEVASVAALPNNSTGEMSRVSEKNVDEAKRISCLSNGTNLLKDMDALGSGQPLKTTSGALIEVQPESTVDLKVQHDKVDAHDSSETDDLKVQHDKVDAHDSSETDDLRAQHDKVDTHDSSGVDILQVDSGKEPATKCIEKSAKLSKPPSVCSNHDDVGNRSDAIALEEPLDHGDYSDVSHDYGHATLSEIEVDYDSQYEDGEVRESIVHTWEDYDGEDMEAENFDYGSDHASDMGCEAGNTMKTANESNFQPSLSGSSGSAKERPLKSKDGNNEVVSGDEIGPCKMTRAVGVVTRENDVEKPSASADSTLKISAWSHRNFSDVLTGLREDRSLKNLGDDCKEVVDTEKNKVRVVSSREFRRELRSRIEGPPLHDAYSKVKTCMQRSSDADNVTPRSEREPEYAESFGRGRYNYHAHARYQGDDHWVNPADGHRGIKHYHSPNYHGPTSFRRSVPESGSICRQKMEASSFIHRRLARSGSPVDREEVFRLRSGFRPSRELSLGRHVTFGRGRSLRYGSQIDGRGSRGRFYRRMPDDYSEPYLNKSHFSTKRGRHFLPIQRREESHVHRSRSKSPSRSRTHSPNSGTPSLRHQSPNFKSEAGMQNMRSPQRPGFLAERMVGYRTMRSSHGSAPHNTRWIGERKDEGAVHFRERGFDQRSSVLDSRSPGRFGPQYDRFDLVDYPGNYRSLHPGRFSKVDGLGRGRLRRDGSDEYKGKHSYRFGLVPSGKRCDIDVDTKLFGNNVDDGFVKARNSRFDDASTFNDRQDLRNLAGAPKVTCQEDLEKRVGHSDNKESENMVVQNHL